LASWQVTALPSSPQPIIPLPNPPASSSTRPRILAEHIPRNLSANRAGSWRWGCGPPPRGSRRRRSRAAPAPARRSPPRKLPSRSSSAGKSEGGGLGSASSGCRCRLSSRATCPVNGWTRARSSRSGTGTPDGVTRQLHSAPPGRMGARRAAGRFTGLQLRALLNQAPVVAPATLVEAFPEVLLQDFAASSGPDTVQRASH
jgi:hypothetical protein